MKPGDSSSMFVTATSAGFRPRYSDAVVLLLSLKTMLKAWLPSETLSSWPVTNTVCSDLQLLESNVRSPGETVASEISPELMSTYTSAVGSLVRRTVKTASPPSSVTVELIDETMKPGDSSSMFVTATSAGFRPRYSDAVVLLLSLKTMLKAWLPSETLSSWPVTNTVCSDLQLLESNVRSPGETVASEISPELMSTYTSAVGSLVRRTVKTASPPSSVTVELIDETMKPAPESKFFRVTSGGSTKI